MGARPGALLAAILALGACYRPEPPPRIDEPVAVRVVASNARLVRAQAYLQESVATRIHNRLGWDITPSGSARLDLVIDKETIDPTAKDTRGVPVQWAVRVNCTVLLAWRGGTRTIKITGIGYYTSPLDEAEGLRTAADQAAASLVDWIEAIQPTPASEAPATPRPGT